MSNLCVPTTVVTDMPTIDAPVFNIIPTWRAKKLHRANENESIKGQAFNGQTGRNKYDHIKRKKQVDGRVVLTTN